MTPRERAEQIIEQLDAWIVSGFPSDKYSVQQEIEKAIISAIEEADDKYANERDSYLETIKRLEDENADLRMKVRRLCDLGEALVKKL